MNYLVVPIIRVLAIFQALNAWHGVWTAIGVAHADGPGYLVVMYWSYPFIYLALAVLFWIGAPWLAVKMTKGIPDTAVKNSSLTFDDVFITATVTAGLLILAQSIPYSGDFLRAVFELKDRSDAGQTAGFDRIEFTFLLYVVLALLLIFKPTGLFKLVHFTRQAGAK